MVTVGSNSDALVLKPRLRGRLHEAAFVVSVPAAAILVTLAPSSEARVAAGIFSVSLAVMFGVSAAYHCGTWSAEARSRMKRLDHSSIFLLIAASYTPFCLLAVHAPGSWLVLAVVWGGAVAGIAIKNSRIDGLHRVTGALYVSLGWAAILAAPAMIGVLTSAELVLVVAGGLLYTTGAAVFATGRPDPSPAWFGYHEVWHAFTIAAAACHYAAVMLVVLGAR
jgi:hemolysin III